jgi:hypothetical protein
MESIHVITLKDDKIVVGMPALSLLYEQVRPPIRAADTRGGSAVDSLASAPTATAPPRTVSVLLVRGQWGTSVWFKMCKDLSDIAELFTHFEPDALLVARS